MSFFKKEGEKMGMNAGTVYSELVLKGDSFFSGLQKADRETQSFEKKLESFGNKSKAVGKSLTTKLTLPIVGVGTAATILGMDFDSSMSEVQAISGATGEDMVKLEGIAREMGATTKFSAQDASEGLKYMAMAGWKTQEMMDGLPGILALAAASGEDLGTTSDIVTDSLTGFGMAAGDAGKFADLLASASSNSNTNVALMGETFKYVAPLFGALGYSAEDAALATGLMANAGIKGSQAGTTLRAAITNLVKPSKAAAGVMEELGITTTDASGEMKPFDVLLGDLRSTFGKLTDEQKAQKAATLFGKEAMSGMLAIINASDEDYQKLTKATTDYNGAATEMAAIMEGNLKGKINNIKSALEEAALKIYNAMLPSLEALADKIQLAVDWFNGLDESSQKNIVKFGLFAAAIGPVLLVVGSLAGSISNIVGVAKLAGGALGLLGTGATAAAGAGTATGVAGLSSAIGAGVVAFAPWVLGAGAVAGAAYLISKELKENTLPAVELFGYGISEATEKAVGDFLELENEATTSLRQMVWSGEEITEEMKESIGGNFAAMKDTIVNELEEQKAESIDILTNLYSESETITKEELAKDLERLEKNYEDQKLKTEEGNRRIQEILDNAAKEKRELKESEVEEINTLNEVMKKDAVKVLSESEAEQLAILRSLELESGKITAIQAAEIVKNSKKAKDGAVKEAEGQYKESLKFAEQLRREGGAENEAMADKVEKEAKRQRDAAVAEAGKMHQGVVKEAKAQAGEHVRQVDWESGQLMTKWQTLSRWFARNPIIRKIQEIKEAAAKTPSQYSYTPGNKAHGTEHFSGGWTWVGEQGRELVNLPRGSQIKSNPKSENMAGVDYNKIADAFVAALKKEGISKPTIIELDGRSVGKGLVNILDGQLNNKGREDDIGRGGLAW